MYRLSMISLFIALLLPGCKQSPSSNYMILDEVTYINKFPKTFSLKDGKLLDLDIIGTLSMKICDSLMIVSTSNGKGYWSFFSLPGYEYMGQYLMNGKGPNEFTSPPWVEQEHFLKEQGRLFALIYDFSTGHSFKMDIYETLKNKQLKIDTTGYSLPRILFNLAILDDNTFLCKEINGTQTQHIRYLLDNGERKTSGILERLSRPSVRKSLEQGILSTHIKSSPDGNRIVEAALALNQINLYSVDNSFGKTICVGKRVDNIEDVENKARPDRMYTYMGVNAYPGFFGALYLNDTDWNYDEGKFKTPSIQFFDWDGNPLAEIKLDRSITSYDIDFLNGSLYTMSYQTEEIYRYDISDILKTLGAAAN